MIKIFATASPDSGGLLNVVSALRARPDFQLLGTASTGQETLAALKTATIDALLVSHDLADVGRLIRVAAGIPLQGPPIMVAASDDVSVPIRARSLACGFDGVVDVGTGHEVVAMRLAEMVQGEHRLSDDASLRDLEIPPGILARSLRVNDTVDRRIVDLVGAGLDDHEIAAICDESIQEVRNRIEGLIFANNLSSRTHLAIMRASHVVIPDFS